jgi:hypothetical protein
MSAYVIYEHTFAKVGVGRSNRLARSSFQNAKALI